MKTSDRLSDLEASFSQFGSSLEAHSPSLETDREAFALVNHVSEQMRQALSYTLVAGGKRIRPRLCLLLAESIGGLSSRDNALKAARAVELLHTYSLVHDDLPAMDNDDLRRGRPTAHKVFGEAKAILAGDALLTEAFCSLAALQTNHQAHIASQCVQILSQASGYRGMIAGQWLDLYLEDRPEDKGDGHAKKISYETLATLHLLKTGCLIGASLELGLLCGLNEIEVSTQSATQYRELARRAGQEIGLAFQLIDDILDFTGSKEELGKTPGKDARSDKQTAVTILGLEKSQQQAAAETENAMHKINLLFERILPCDDVAQAARQELIELILSLIDRHS